MSSTLKVNIRAPHVDLGNISGAVTLNANGAELYSGTLTGNITLTVTGSGTVGVVFTQDATGGRTVTYGGQELLVATEAGATTLVEFVPAGAGDYRVVYPDGLAMYPGPNVTCWGDSLTAANVYPPALATIIGKTVVARGVGGESSAGIAARQGGGPYRLTPSGNTIPASGGVTVTINSPATWPLLQGPGGIPGALTGTLAGVPGTLTLTKQTPGTYTHESGDVYTFTRTTAGSPVTVARPTAFLTDHAAAARRDLQIIWAGTNDYTLGADVVAANIRAMTRYAEQAEQRFLVLGLHCGRGQGIGTSAATTKAAINLALAREYGERFLDIGAWLATWGLADAGLPAGPADTADMAVGIVPAQLRSDSLHLTTAGYTIVARQIAKRLAELGWATIATPWTEAAGIAAGTNLITNPDFETNTGDWNGGATYPVAISRVTTEQYGGLASLRADFTTDTRALVKTNSAMPITPGTNLRLSARIKAPLGYRVVVQTQQQNAANGSLGAIGSSCVGTGDWVEATFNTAPHADIAKGNLEFANPDGVAATVYIDSVRFWQA